MFEEVNDDLSAESFEKADALTLDVLNTKILKLTATVGQLQEALQTKSDAEICRLTPGELLNFLNSQEVSYALLYRWLINHQLGGQSYAHSLLVTSKRSSGDLALSRQLLSLIRKLPQPERYQFLEQQDPQTNRTLEECLLSFMPHINTHFIEAYIDCLPAATTDTVARDEARIIKYPFLLPFLMTRLESVYTKTQLLTFYQQKIHTIGGYIDWNNDRLVAEFLRILALFSITEQLDILISLPLRAVISFQIIRLLNQLSPSEMADYLHHTNIHSQARALFSHCNVSDFSDFSDDSEDDDSTYYSNVTEEDKNEFLIFLKRLTIDKQFNLLIQDADSTAGLLSRCFNNNIMSEILNVVTGFSQTQQLAVFNSQAFSRYFLSDTSHTFKKRTLSYHLSEEKQSDLIAYLKEIEQLEPSNKLKVLACKVKGSDKSLSGLIEAACSSMAYPNVVVAYLTCLASTKSPISLTHANQQALINVINNLPEEQKIKTCLLALKSGSALHNYLSIKVFSTGFFCMPCTKSPDIYLDQIQAMLPSQDNSCSSTSIFEEQQQHEPLMIDFREENAKNSTLQHRTGFKASI